MSDFVNLFVEVEVFGNFSVWVILFDNQVCLIDRWVLERVMNILGELMTSVCWILEATRILPWQMQWDMSFGWRAALVDFNFSEDWAGLRLEVVEFGLCLYVDFVNLTEATMSIHLLPMLAPTSLLTFFGVWSV